MVLGRPRARWAARTVGAVLGAALVVTTAACSGSDGEDGPEPDDGGGAVPSDLSTPLDPYLAELMGDKPFGQPDPWALRAEEIVSACMAEQGFEYHVDELAGAGGIVFPKEYGTVAFAEQYGYGESIALPGQDVPRLWAAVPISEGRAWNYAYRDSLSPEAQVAYDVALDGDWGELSPNGPPEGPYDPARAGCNGRAVAETSSEGWVGPAEFGDVKRAVNEVWTRVEEDPRVVEALGRWSTCMADAGYPGLETTWDAEGLVATVIFAQWQDEWIDAAGTRLGVTDYDVVRQQIPDGLAELRQREIDLAVSDARCREDSGYLATRHAVQVEVEKEVVDTYEADLEAWITWVRENEPAL